MARIRHCNAKNTVMMKRKTVSAGTFKIGSNVGGVTMDEDISYMPVGGGATLLKVTVVDVPSISMGYSKGVMDPYR